MNHLKISATAAGVVFALGAGAANAASISNLVFPATFFEDDNAESLIDNNQNGILDVGDDLRGILNIVQLVDAFPGLEPPVSLASASGNNELAGVFSTRVAAICAPNSLALGGCAPYAGEATADYLFTFTPGFAATVGAANPVNATAVIALFEDSDHEWTINNATGEGDGTACTTVGAGNDCEANIVDGTLWATAGFAGDADEAFFGADIAVDVVGSGLSNLLSQSFGEFNYALSVLENNTGRELEQVVCLSTCAPGGDGLVDIVGSGSPLGVLRPNGSRATPYDITTDTDFLAGFAPEPNVLALLGAGLFAAGVVRRKA